MRGGDEMGGFGEKQGVGGGGRNQMVVLHNPTPRGWLSMTLLLGRDGIASDVQSSQKYRTHMNSILFSPSSTIMAINFFLTSSFLKTPGFVFVHCSRTIATLSLLPGADGGQVGWSISL